MPIFRIRPGEKREEEEHRQLQSVMRLMQMRQYVPPWNNFLYLTKIVFFIYFSPFFHGIRRQLRLPYVLMMSPLNSIEPKLSYSKGENVLALFKYCNPFIYTLPLNPVYLVAFLISVRISVLFNRL